MREKISDILMQVESGKKNTLTACNEIIKLIEAIDEFKIDASNLSLDEQAKFRLLLSGGEVEIKVAI